MNSQSQSSSSPSQSPSAQSLLSQLADTVSERNRSDCLISELRFLAGMMKIDGILHQNIESIISKADYHITRRWSQLEESELAKNK